MEASGNQLKNERERRGWTQIEIARRLGVKQHSISRLEAAEKIRVKWITKLDKVFEGPGWRGATTVRQPLGAVANTGSLLNEVIDRLVAIELQLHQMKERLEEHDVALQLRRRSKAKTAHSLLHDS